MFRALRFVSLSALLLLAARPATEPSPAPAPGASSKVLAYLDPATGRLSAPPREVEVRWAEATAEELAAAKRVVLRERAGATSAGGYEVDLSSRFQSRVVATLTGEGQLTSDCALGEATPAGSQR